jgi:hypothetical protein
MVSCHLNTRTEGCTVVGAKACVPRPLQVHGNVIREMWSFHEKVPAGGGLWCGSGESFLVGGLTKGLLLVENSMTHQGVTLLRTYRLKTSSSWEWCVVSAPLLCAVGVVIMFYIESHWIRQNTWKPTVCYLLSGCGINAFRMVSSNCREILRMRLHRIPSRDFLVVCGQ